MTLSLVALLAPALAGPTLAVSGPCPGRVTFTARDLTPGTEIAVLVGRDGLGDDDVPDGPCIGDDTDLAGVQLVASGIADAGGGFAMRPAVPAPACGLAVQLLDLTSCRDTNAVRFVGDGLFEADAIASDLSFAEAGTPDGPSTIAWDGDYWWHGDGGYSGPMVYYGRRGALLGATEPMVGVRSAFTKGDGTLDVFLRAVDDNTIWEPDGFGAWTRTGPTLEEDHILGHWSRMAYDIARSEYVVNTSGRVGRWDESGALVGILELVDYGIYGFEYDRHAIAVTHAGHYLTYADGVVSAWDPDTGERLDRVVLVGADWDYSAVHTFSYANGRAMVFNTEDAYWYGYPLGI